jgi:hypothetical protein
LPGLKTLRSVGVVVVRQSFFKDERGPMKGRSFCWELGEGECLRGRKAQESKGPDPN